MKNRLWLFPVLLILLAAIPYSSLVVPVQAAQDARSITYVRDSAGNWSVRGPVCPRTDSSVVTGAPPFPCVEATASIATPSGAFLTQLKADYKLVVLASGYPSGD